MMQKIIESKTLTTEAMQEIAAYCINNPGAVLKHFEKGDGLSLTQSNIIKSLIWMQDTSIEFSHTVSAILRSISYLSNIDKTLSAHLRYKNTVDTNRAKIRALQFYMERELRQKNMQDFAKWTPTKTVLLDYLLHYMEALHKAISEDNQSRKNQYATEITVLLLKVIE